MKKRLFISSILMTLVLLVAITTATFAWYQASTGGTVAKGDGRAQTATVNTSATINVSIDGAKLAVSEGTLVFNSNGVVTADNRTAQEALPLQLAQYSSGWKTKYLLPNEESNSNGIEYTGETGHVTWQCFEFTVSYDLSTLSAPANSTVNDAFDAMHTAAEEFSVTVQKTLVNDQNDSHNYGVFKIEACNAGGIASGDAVVATAWTPSTDAQYVNLTIGAAHDATISFRVYVYCDGNAHTYSDVTPNANFTLVVGAKNNG